MSNNLHSLCVTMTIGRRPELLDQTLHSLKPILDNYSARAINDFGDEETNKVFRTHCPNGTLLVNETQLGHHKTIDRLYDGINSTHILHIEDDWHFHSLDFLNDAIELLLADPNISIVALRSLSDMQRKDYETQAQKLASGRTAYFARLDQTSTWWHGYTFNPHIIKTADLKEIGQFSRYKKERNISRMMKKKGRFVAYMEPGFCTHIGEDNSVSGNDFKDKGKIYKKYKTIKNKIKYKFS